MGALDLGGGDDLLKLDAGSTVQGKADGGEGFDTIQILADVLLGDLVNFEKLLIDDGATLTLASGLEFHQLLGAIIEGDTIENIVGNGHDIVYRVHDAANAYLQGRNYQLVGGGQLIAVPEPGTAMLLAPALAALLAARRRKPAAAA